MPFAVSRWLAAFAAIVAFAPAPPAGAQTLAAVKERGTLVCGVSQGLAGFSAANDKGEWSGFDADFCRAVAAAVLGDASKVKFVPLSASERFDALKSGGIDLLARNTTWTMGRETQLGLLFAGTTYYDGQGFLVPKSKGVVSALISLAFPYPAHTALVVGAGRSQIGEFSFILGQAGRTLGLLDDTQYSLILAGALVSIISRGGTVPPMNNSIRRNSGGIRGHYG